MLSYEDARARLLADVSALPSESVCLETAHGRVLARPLRAALTQPPFPASAMDGYAVRWKDMPGPWAVIGESAAGHAYDGGLGEGEAVRIFTGAPVPAGADTVIAQEDVAIADNSLRLHADGPPHRGAHIRPVGNDFREGDDLIPAGRRVSPEIIGLAAAAGHDRLEVVGQPRIAIIATGDELVPPGTAPGPAQIVAGNGAMLSAMLTASGARVTDFGIVPDNQARIADVISKASGHDIILTIGGASVGDHDLVRDALVQAGASLDFWRIAIKPGKPLIAGTLGRTRLIGLPGNPVSAHVCTLLFVRPLLRALQGRASEEELVIARLGADLTANGDRRDHLRATLKDGLVTPLATQDSAQLAVLARADALIVRPPYAKAVRAGADVPVLLLDRT